jgi:hypothetical protein
MPLVSKFNLEPEIQSRTGFVARLFRGGVLFSLGQKTPASEEAGYNHCDEVTMYSAASAKF